MHRDSGYRHEKRDIYTCANCTKKPAGLLIQQEQMEKTRQILFSEVANTSCIVVRNFVPMFGFQRSRNGEYEESLPGDLVCASFSWLAHLSLEIMARFCAEEIVAG